MTTTIARNGATLKLSVVPWDSEIFGFAVAQIVDLEVGDDASAQELLPELDAWCAIHDVHLISCRLDHERLRESMALEAIGFRFVEMTYGPRLKSLDDTVAPDHLIHITEASHADLGAIEEIAYSAFSTGRFLLDRRLDPELSSRRYANWVRTSFIDARHAVLKAEVDGDLVGFFIVERRPDAGVYWHLTAIAPRCQGKGIGLSLWRTMLLRHRREGATYVETTISGHNVPAINLYGRLGFSFASAQMTFHRFRVPNG